MSTTWRVSCIRCHGASKAPHEVGRATKQTPSIVKHITLVRYIQNRARGRNTLDLAYSGRIFPELMQERFF